MKFDVIKRDLINITAQTLGDCDEVEKLFELLKKGQEVNLHVRYDVPPVRLDYVKIKKA